MMIQKRRNSILALNVVVGILMFLAIGNIVGSEVRQSRVDDKMKRYVYRGLTWRDTFRNLRESNDDLYEYIYKPDSGEDLNLVLWQGEFKHSPCLYATGPVYTLVISKDEMYGIVELRTEVELSKIKEELQTEDPNSRNQMQNVLEDVEASMYELGDWERLYYQKLNQSTAKDVLVELSDAGVFDDFDRTMGDISGCRIAVVGSGISYAQWYSGSEESAGGQLDFVAQNRKTITGIIERYLRQEYEVTDAKDKETMKARLCEKIKECNALIQSNSDSESDDIEK